MMCDCGRGLCKHAISVGTKLTHNDYLKMPEDIFRKAKFGRKICSECFKDVSNWWKKNGENRPQK